MGVCVRMNMYKGSFVLIGLTTMNFTLFLDKLNIAISFKQADVFF